MAEPYQADIAEQGPLFQREAQSNRRLSRKQRGEGVSPDRALQRLSSQKQTVRREIELVVVNATELGSRTQSKMNDLVLRIEDINGLKNIQAGDCTVEVMIKTFRREDLGVIVNLADQIKVPHNFYQEVAGLFTDILSNKDVAFFKVAQQPVLQEADDDNAENQNRHNRCQQEVLRQNAF